MPQKFFELYPAGRIKLFDPMLTEDHQEALLAYLWKNKRSMVERVISNANNKDD